MIIHDVEQGSEEWDRLRLGIPTSSEFHKIVTPKDGKLSKQAEGYMHVLLAEWLYGAPLESVETQWMQRGKDLEDEAVRSYEFETEVECQKVGFITSDGGMVGCSPDRLADQDGLLEIKCPAPHTHVGYMVKRSADREYWPQVQGQLWIAERDWVDIQSYCPGFPTVIIRVTRDEPYIDKLREALTGFLETMLAAREALAKNYPIHREPIPVLVDSLGITDEDVDAIVADRFHKENA